ncbi:MAG: histidine phosphatase family protein [Desulfobacterales bacterium]|nr:histidine phosphatase family protein [Desulfobacterales bacterium]
MDFPKWIQLSLAAFTLLYAVEALAQPDDLVPRLQAGGHVLMLRHALAPGTGDPSGFRLGDCRTQRNLNDRGRDQARGIGAWLHAQGVSRARVFSSQWCRCLETAALLDLGPVTPLPALNSFFERPQERELRLAALRDFIARQPLDGELIILVTHYVTIAGLTGEGVSSGEAIVLTLTEGNPPGMVGRLNFTPE